MLENITSIQSEKDVSSQNSQIETYIQELNVEKQAKITQSMYVHFGLNKT